MAATKKQPAEPTALADGTTRLGTYRERFLARVAELEANPAIKVLSAGVGDPVDPALLDAAAARYGVTLSAEERELYARMNGCWLVWVGVVAAEPRRRARRGIPLAPTPSPRTDAPNRGPRCAEAGAAIMVKRAWVGWVLGGAALALGAACGAPSSPAGAGGATTASTTTGVGGAGGAGDGCPAERPGEGDTCATGLACAFAAPDLGDGCTLDYACPKTSWVSGLKHCPVPPDACPGGPPAEGAACALDGKVCSYSDSEEYPCEGTTATCKGGAWSVVTSKKACDEGCPASPPTNGDSCAYCCVTSCNYAVEGCAGIGATCLTGGGPPRWSVEGGCLPSDAGCTGHVDAADCEATAGCRWLVPGCGDTPLPPELEGCHAAADCTPGVDCAGGGAPSPPGGKLCRTFLVDPCWKGDCNTCAASASTCWW